MADYSHKEAEHTPDEARKHDLKKIKANLRKIDKARVYRNIGSDAKKIRSGGVLADLAPTLLQLMGIEQPKEMTGKTLIEE